MKIQVPSLSQLKSYSARGEAAVAKTVAAETVVAKLDQSGAHSSITSAESPAFQQQFCHILGEIGPDGEVSLFAMDHYVELVQRCLAEVAEPLNQTDIAQLLLSVGIGPNGQKRIEVDFLPDDSLQGKESLLEQLAMIAKRIGQIEAPPVRRLPVAFGLIRYFRSDYQPARPLRAFPNLSLSITSPSIGEALYQSFGIQSLWKTDATPTLATTTPWWRKFLSYFRKKPVPVEAGPTAQETHASQAEWLAKCQQLAGQLSWLDLKRAAVENPEDYRYRIAMGEKHYDQQAYDAAIKSFDGVIDKISFCPPLTARRAQLHLAAGNSQAALRDYSEAIEAAPQVAAYRAGRAGIFWGLQAWDQAVVDLDAAIGLAPIDPGNYCYRGQTRLEQGQSSGAVDDFCEAIRLDPNFGNAHFRLGWLYTCLFQEKLDEALWHLSRAIELTGDNGEMRLCRSHAYLTQNKFALAIEDCDIVLTATPNYPAAHGLRGRALQCDDQFDEAITACTRAIELGHENASVYIARAISYASTEQMALADSDCEIALSLEPNNPLAVQIQGRLKLQMGDLDGAMSAFNRARELHPEWDEPREHLALVHRMKENPQAAIEEQTQLIEQHPKQASHYINRAFAFKEMHAYTEAADDYDRAIELEPENERLYLFRGIFRMNCQESELALADFDRVLAIAGDDNHARHYRAQVLIQLRRYTEAIDDYAKLISKYPDVPDAYLGRAFAFAALGNDELAQRDVERLAELNPESADYVDRDTRTASLYRFMHDEDYDAALESANQIVADYPDQSSGYRLRAYVRWEREEYVESHDDYTHVLENDGPSSDCLSSRGQVLAELGEYERALEDLNKSVDMAREAGQTIVLAYALNGRSLTWGSMQREEESNRDFEESVTLCPTNPWVYYHRGIRKFNSNEWKDAKILLELALELTQPPLSKRKKQRARNALARIADKRSQNA